METVFINLALTLLEEVPALIDSVQKSAALSEEQKKAKIAQLSAALEKTRARVAAVTFKDV